MTESLISSGDPVPIMPSMEGRIGDRLRNRAHIGAARAVPRPIHFEVVDFAPFPIGGAGPKVFSATGCHGPGT